MTNNDEKSNNYPIDYDVNKRLIFVNHCVKWASQTNSYTKTPLSNFSTTRHRYFIHAYHIEWIEKNTNGQII